MKRKHILAIVIAIVAVLIIGRQVASNENDEITQAPTKQVDLIDIAAHASQGANIIAVGEVEAANQLDLKSQLSERVVGVYVGIGDTIRAGQLLVELDHAVLDAQLSQAGAAVERAKANVNQLVVGASDEDIRQAKASLNQVIAQKSQTQIAGEQKIRAAKQVLLQAENNLRQAQGGDDSQVVRDAYDDAINTLVAAPAQLSDALFQTDLIVGVDNKSANDAFESSLSGTNPSLYNTTRSLYQQTRNAYKPIEQQIFALTPGAPRESVDAILNTITPTFAEFDALLNNMLQLLTVNRDITGLTDTELTTLRKNIITAKANVTGVQTNVINAKQAIDTAKNAFTSVNISYQDALTALNQTEDQVSQDVAIADSLVSIQQALYDKLVSDPRSVDLAPLQANVAEAQSSYANVAANRNKAFIRAPISGTISTIDLQIGDLVTAGQSLVSLVDTNGLQVRAFVSISDRARLQVGDQVIIANTVSGTIARISPSANEQNKKVEIIIAIEDGKEALTVGQFADLQLIPSVQTQGQQILLPLAAVKITASSAFVLTINEDNILERKDVTYGSVTGTAIPILSGLDGNERIVASVRGLQPGESVNPNQAQ